MIKKTIFLLLSFLLLFSNIKSQNYNLITDSSTVYWPMPTLSKPAYLDSAIDPTFGTKITRVTGDAGATIPTVGGNWGNVSRHGYSKRTAWNADESILRIDKHKTVNSGGSTISTQPTLFLDGQTYQVISAPSTPSSRESRWHPTLPNIMLLLRDGEVVHWDVINNTTTTVFTFSGYSNCYLGPWEGNFSNDGNSLAVNATRNSDGKNVAFAINIATSTKYPDLDLTGIGVDWVSISSSGNYIVINGVFSGSDQTQVYDLNGNPVGSLWSSYGRPSHYDLAIDDNGDDVAVGVSKSSPDEGRVIKRRLSDGAVTVLTSGGYASHTSARCINRPGWAITSFQHRTGNTWLPYFSEVVAVKLDGTRVERICNTRGLWSIYDNETQSCPSPSGDRVIFASDWDANGAPIQGYVVDFRNKLISTNNPPVANAGSDKTICPNDSVQLTATGSGSYLWNTGDTNANIWVNPSTTTTYSVTVTNSYGSDIDSVLVNTDTNLCPKTVCFNGNSITIDGNEDPTWANTFSDSISKTIAGSITNSSDLSVSFKLTWDNTNLYLIAHINDDIKTNDSPNEWSDDGIEIFIDGNNEKNSTYDVNDRQYIIRWNDNTIYEHGYNTSTNPMGVNFAQTNTPNGYIIEGTVSWSAIGVTPSNGKLVGFEIQVNDDDNGGTDLEARKSWFALVSPSSDASLMGEIELNNSTCNNSTSINSLSNNSIIIYPNPTNGKIWIEGNISNITLVEIFDLSGKKVKTINQGKASNFIDISSLTKGTYIINIKQDNHNNFSKIIKK